MTKFSPHRVKGAYSVEFVLIFIAFISIVFFAAELNRFYLVKAVLDANFSALVKDARTNNIKSVSALTDKYFNDSSLFNKDDLKITAKSCSGISVYLRGECNSGLGRPQDIVHYRLSYTFTSMVPILSGRQFTGWQHESVLIVRNEPDFDSGEW